MTIVEKPKAQETQRLDFERFRLRRFLDALPAEELDTRAAPTELRDVAAAIEGNAKAVRFAAVGAERQELVGNVCGARSRLALAFGVPPEKLCQEVQRRLRKAPEIVEVSRTEAPVQEVVLTGDEADLTALPVHLQHGADGAPYISASTDFVIDPKTGWTNVGMRRLMLRGRTRNRHRSRRAERSEGDLRGECRRRTPDSSQLLPSACIRSTMSPQ